MNNKIEWYQEVLALEPGSKIFFQLARLFADAGNEEDAVNTLSRGLDRHPDFLEARLLLIDLLSGLGRMEEARETAEPVVAIMKRYPVFWRLWAEQLPEADPDFMVALSFASAHLSGRDLTWAGVLKEGISSLSGFGAPSVADMDADILDDAGMVVPEALSMEEQEAALDEDEPGTLRTRTMAGLLSAQGDYRGALEIYEELYAAAGSEDERSKLEERIAQVRGMLEGGEGKAAEGMAGAAASGEDPFTVHAKNKLISTLERLASRLEARAVS